ncbi:hypothetical protein NPIL_82281 [Nephila pilipes]|uniref:Uncharacterized protein n=1 Tax=Nephila pilipes TaxID=299642 RepID=A0A8X6R4W8_NEPPI|nr:hypothetical protein NPIL_82281 [Nephila pilipes]
MSFLLRALNEDLQEVTTGMGIKDVSDMTRMGLHNTIIDPDEYIEEEVKILAGSKERREQLEEKEKWRKQLEAEERRDEIEFLLQKCLYY